MEMNEKKQLNQLIKELSEKIIYWQDKNEDFMNAYMIMLHNFTMPNMGKDNQ